MRFRDEQSDTYEHEHNTDDDHQSPPTGDVTPRRTRGLCVLWLVRALRLVVVRIVECAAELAHALTDGASGGREPRGAENEQGDDAYDEQLEWSDLEHDTESRAGLRRAPRFQRAGKWILTRDLAQDHELLRVGAHRARAHAHDVRVLEVAQRGLVRRDRA